MTTWAAITFQSKSQLIPPPLPPTHTHTHTHRNTFTNHTKYKFAQTDREVLESTLEEALGFADFSGHLSTGDLDKYADFIVTAISTAVDKAITTSKSVQSESNPISDETKALSKEKRRLKRHYSQNKDPAIKTRINQLQKQVKIESLVSWEKFCNSISLETNSNESWRKIKNFVKPLDYQLCATQTKSPRPTPIKHNSLPNLSKGISGKKATILIESFHEVNKLLEDNHR